MIVVVAPGQGSQSPGFLSPWLELDGARERLEAYGDAAGVDLVAHGTVSDADTIRDTAVAQPLIVAASLLSLAALESEIAAVGGARPGGIAGHSVGEIAALVGAGVLDAADGMHLVGVNVSELVHEGVLAMEFKGSADDLARICHAHPSLSEAVHDAAMAVHKRAIHKAN